MRASDVTETIELALTASGCDQAIVQHKPRLLSDNGSCYVSADLAEWMEEKKMEHVRGDPFHPQTQGKIERWHQTMKNRILLENYYLPDDLEQQIGVFVDHYKNHRYHESPNNVTPAGVYFGRAKGILRERETIKKQTIEYRRLKHKRQATLSTHQMNQSLHCSSRPYFPIHMTTDKWVHLSLNLKLVNHLHARQSWIAICTT